MLTAELALPADHLSGAVHAVLALALTDAGRTREAVGVAVTALAAILPRDQRSMARYAAALLDDSRRRPLVRAGRARGVRVAASVVPQSVVRLVRSAASCRCCSAVTSSPISRFNALNSGAEASRGRGIVTWMSRLTVPGRYVMTTMRSAR